MSTRALYTFIGDDAADTWNVYKHHDGYPTGAADTLQIAVDWFAWPLPRYEADAFACAFIAAAKCAWLSGGKIDRDRLKAYGPKGKYRSYNGGGARMMPQGNPLDVASTNCSDIEYRYEVSAGNDSMGRIRAYTVNAWGDTATEQLILDCSLADFPAQAKTWEDSQREAA